MEKAVNTNLKNVPDFDDIVFAIRNREYGAYVLRRNYSRNVIISLIAAVVIMTSGVVAPFLRARALDSLSMHGKRKVENIVTVTMEQPAERLAPPPVAPPPSESVQAAKYIPPVIVDSVKPEDEMSLMTADEASLEVQNTEVVDVPVAIKEEVQEDVPEIPFTVVEEMPLFPGGDAELMSYIATHLIYPPLAQENNIQGRVTVKFCVNSKGGISQISIIKGIDAELDKEAIRVVSTLPAFKPGKQGGVPVPVWYTVPINFKLITN
ncbi:MAG: energy transducer TonB [Methanosarcina sp.]